jgi:hypothetical protein
MAQILPQIQAGSPASRREPRSVASTATQVSAQDAQRVAAQAAQAWREQQDEQG